MQAKCVCQPLPPRSPSSCAPAPAPRSPLAAVCQHLPPDLYPSMSLDGRLLGPSAQLHAPGATLYCEPATVILRLQLLGASGLGRPAGWGGGQGGGGEAGT